MSLTLLVTGATAGFGAAITRRFVRDGHRVVATGRRAERLRQLHEILRAEDISDVKKVKKIRFVANLLLPPPEQPAQPEKAPA